MKKLLQKAASVAAVLMFAAAGAYSAPQVDFDQGLADSASVLKTARKKAKTMKTSFKLRPAGGISRWDIDCEDIAFTDKDSLISESVLLQATIYERRCTDLGRYGGQICHEAPFRHESRRVRLKVTGRAPLAEGQKEVFRVCLNGFWLNASVKQSNLKYKFIMPEGYDFEETIEARVVKKEKK